MKTSELLKKFGKNNIKFVEHRTKHDYYYRIRKILTEFFFKITGKTFPIPRHKSEIKKGTLHSILTDAGLK